MMKEVVVGFLLFTSQVAQSKEAREALPACTITHSINYDFGRKTSYEETSGGWDPSMDNYPRAVVVDSNENVYVGDSVNYQLVKFNEEGIFLKTISLQPPGNIVDANTRNWIKKMGFIISALAADKDDNIYAINRYLSRVEVYDKSGKFVRSFSISFGGRSNSEDDRIFVSRDGRVFIANGIVGNGDIGGTGSIFLDGKPVKEHLGHKEWNKFLSQAEIVGNFGYSISSSHRPSGIILNYKGKEIGRCGPDLIGASVQYSVDKSGDIVTIAADNKVRIIKIHVPRNVH